MNRMFRMIAGDICSFTYNVFIGGLPSRRLRKWYLYAYLSKFASSANIQRNCRFLNGRKVSVGDNSVINFGTFIDGRQFDVTIKANVSIGPEAAILTLGHDTHSADFLAVGGPVTIENRAWIGFRAIILPGVTIGEGAVVAAGAVVSRDVAPFTVVAGVPAKVVGERSSDLRYELKFAPFLG